MKTTLLLFFSSIPLGGLGWHALVDGYQVKSWSTIVIGILFFVVAFVLAINHGRPLAEKLWTNRSR